MTRYEASAGAESVAQLLEQRRSNRELVVRDNARDASSRGLWRLRDRNGRQRHFDRDDLLRFGERFAAVHVHAVDRVLVAVYKQHRILVLFGHAADPIVDGETAS